MAYRFIKTSSSDYINWPVLGQPAARLNGAAKVSWVSWVKFYSLTAVTEHDNLIFRAMITTGNASTGAGIFVTMSKPQPPSNHFQVGTRSMDTDAVQYVWTDAIISTLQVWYHFGFMADYAADAITLYINGEAQSVSTQPTYGQTSFQDDNNQTANDGFSSNGASTNHHLDGDIAEMGLWGSDIGAAAFAALAAGTVPLIEVSRSTLVSYTPLRHHLQDIVAGDVLTITGSVPQAAHPPLVKLIDTPRVNPYSSRARRRA